MSVDVRTERLRVLLDPWCDHDDAALDGTDPTDIALALACIEARRDAYDAAWTSLAAVLDALDRHGTTNPEVAIERSSKDDDLPTLAQLLLAAMAIGWHNPYDTRQGGG